MQVLRGAETLGLLQQREHLGPLAGVPGRVGDGLGHQPIMHPLAYALLAAGAPPGPGLRLELPTETLPGTYRARC
jgi:hypothetical protein